MRRTNRKSYTRFRFVPKSMTLDDLERPVRTLAEKMRFTQGQSIKRWPLTSRTRCRAIGLSQGEPRDAFWHHWKAHPLYSNAGLNSKVAEQKH